MALKGRIIPLTGWPSHASTWDADELYTPANQTEYGQAIWNALRTLQMGNLDLVERAYSTSGVCGFGDEDGSLLVWAGTIRVAAGRAANHTGHRDMIGGDWTNDGLRNVADSVSVSAKGLILACQSYRADALYDEMEFFNAAGTETGQSHPTGNVDFVAVVYSAYSGLFLLADVIGGNNYIHSTDGTGATPTWTLEHTWGVAGAMDGVLAADPTGRYVLCTGVVGSYVSVDGGASWTLTTTDCHSTAATWDVLNSRWLRAHDTDLAYNTTAGILAGTAWTTVTTFDANCTDLIQLPGGLLIARLSSSAAYYSEDAGGNWSRLAVGVGRVRYNGGYVAAFQAGDSTYISRRVG